MLFPFYLVTLFLSSASEAQGTASTCSLASFDRCGPATQVPGTPSTCNATLTNSPGAPAVYGVLCTQSSDLQASLVGGTCVNAATDICNKLTDPHVIRDRWIWSAPGFFGCALGFWLPSGNGTDAAFAPDWNRCMEGIFLTMAANCTNPSWNNIGSVNLRILPNSTTTGLPVDPLYPSYLIAPRQLTTYAYDSELNP